MMVDMFYQLFTDGNTLDKDRVDIYKPAPYGEIPRVGDWVYFVLFCDVDTERFRAQVKEVEWHHIDVDVTKEEGAYILNDPLDYPVKVLVKCDWGGRQIQDFLGWHPGVDILEGEISKALKLEASS